MNQATYSPEDNKLRLYVGRVPREEYLKLKEQGWTSTPKQDCDFVAAWTPERRDMALSYADVIEDEDQPAAERAADRAERFGGYRDKRTNEACGHADNYEAGPSAHGYQSQARAERSAARHDRLGSKAADAWSKAEYWQERTAGVIAHALHMSAPGVRMGRIKTIEADLRRVEGRTDERGIEWANHYRLRLAYENQMLAAQGGRLEQEDVQAGGKLGGRLILRVSKSSVTKRVTAVYVLGPKVSGWAYQVSNIINTEYAEYKFETERLNPESYTPPTDESLAELKKFKAEFKKAAQAVAAPVVPLINPTDEDAERLQALWNERVSAKWQAKAKESPYSYIPPFIPSTVLRIKQATYSASSGGTYSRAETTDVLAGGETPKGWERRSFKGKSVCKVRVTDGESYMAERVIILTDKPQKPLPAAVWEVSITNGTGDWEAKAAAAVERSKQYQSV